MILLTRLVKDRDAASFRLAVSGLHLLPDGGTAYALPLERIVRELQQRAARCLEHGMSDHLRRHRSKR